MNNFQLIERGIDTTALLLNLTLNPDLWNAHRLRRERPQNAHAETSDIWVRYNSPDKIDTPEFTDLHYPVWYEAYHRLPQIRPLCFYFMGKLQATHLGGVLITKIPPGGRVYPHTDKGWHPESYPAKLYIPLQTNDYCVNRVQDESVIMNVGDCWYFRNTVEHEVINNGPDDRITLIICLRLD